MATDTAQAMELDTLAARLAEATTQTTPPESVLARFIARHWGNSPASNQRFRLPSGLEPDEAAGLASALAAALRDTRFPVTEATFRPENIRLQPALTGWQVLLTETTGPDLNEKASLAAFTGLLYRLAVGQEFAPDQPGQKTQLAQLRQLNPYLAGVFDAALSGKFSSIGALAGGFGWSLYRKTYLSFPALVVSRKSPTGKQPANRKASNSARSLPDETADKPATRRSPGGPVALVSLAVAMVLLAGTIAFSVSGLDRDYSQQSLAPTVTQPPTPTIAPTPTTPAVALQTSRQADGSTLTRYNPAYDQTSGNQYTDPAKLASGQVAALSNFRELQIQSTSWSADGKQVNLALKDGGWETWDIASKQRVSRKELPNAEQYKAVSWSPDGQNFVAVGLDNQLSLGKADRVLKTVNLSQGTLRASNFSTYPWPFSWSPNSAEVLIAAPNNTIQLWNFQNIPTQVAPPVNSQGAAMSMRGNNLFGTIVWSGDSQYLARLQSGLLNQQVEVYNPRNLARLYTMTIVDIPGVNNPQTGQNTGLTTDGTPGLSWSPDGRYMAIIRYFHLDQGGTAKTYLESSVGALVTLLEVPDAATIRKAGSGTQVATQATPSAVNGQQVEITNPAPLTPPHLQTLTLTGLTDTNTAGGRNLVWSKNDRLMVIGNPAQATSSQPLSYQAMTLDLQTESDAWRWQIGTVFDLPFQTPFNYVDWLPDSQQILYNTTDNMLGVGLVPEEAGKAVTAQTLYQAIPNDYSYVQPSPDGKSFLQILVKDRVYKFSIRDSATGQVVAELATPDGSLVTPGSAFWSPDSRVLVVPFTLQTNAASGTPQTGQIIRAWQFEAEKAPALLGDLLLPPADDNFYINFNNNMAFDGKDATLSLLFETSKNQVARWNFSKPLPSLDQQRQQTDSPYYEVIGQIPGKVSNGGTGNWTWLPDHKRLIFCTASNCFIQQLLTPGAAYNNETDRGIAFNPQPLTGTTTQPGNTPYNPVISPDGRMVVIGLPGGLVNLYDATTGKLFNSFTAHQAAIGALSFSPDGHYLVTSGFDRAVKVWDTTTWRSLAVLRLTTPTSKANQVQWLADNKTLMVGAAYSGNMLFWHALA